MGLSHQTLAHAWDYLTKHLRTHGIISPNTCARMGLSHQTHAHAWDYLTKHLRTLGITKSEKSQSNGGTIQSKNMDPPRDIITTM